MYKGCSRVIGIELYMLIYFIFLIEDFIKIIYKERELEVIFNCRLEIIVNIYIVFVLYLEFLFYTFNIKFIYLILVIFFGGII